MTEEKYKSFLNFLDTNKEAIIKAREKTYFDLFKAAFKKSAPPTNQGS